MQGGIFSYVLLAGLATALLVAAYTDLRRRQIDNWLNIAIALGAPAFWLASGYSWVDVGFQIALALAVGLVAVIFFATNQMGGGDVKLLAALALWVVPLQFMSLAAMLAFLGGGAMVAQGLIFLKRDEQHPLRWVLATGVSVVFILLCAVITFGMVRGKPLLDGENIAAINGFIPNAATFWMVLILVLAIFSSGILYVARNQRERRGFPYGVIISIAGLWVLTSQYLPSLQPQGQLG